MSDTTYNFTVQDDDIFTQSRKRLDKYIALQPIDLSRARIQKLLQHNAINVNNIIINDANYKLKLSDIVTITIPPNAPLALEAEPIELDILFEDDDIIVLNKPAGMVVHPSNGHDSGTLVHALLYHAKGKLSGINGVTRPGIVHRLDKDTSGIMLACKSEKAHRILAHDFHEHAIDRQYIALCFGEPPSNKATIRNYISRDNSDRKKYMVSRQEQGKLAITDYTIMQRYTYCSKILCTLHTGRTHQVRVHLSHIKCPLIGDSLYGAKGRSIPHYIDMVYRDNIKHFARQALHAYHLGFTHPISKKYMAFTRDVPDDMRLLEQILQQLPASHDDY